MSPLDHIRYWLAKPYISQVWMNGYETGKIVGRKERDEEMEHINPNWQPTTFKPALIGARERAKLAAFKRANLKRLTSYNNRGKI